MANTKDYSTVPAVITITNIDPGVIDKELTSVVHNDTTDKDEVKIVYLTEPMEQKIQLYRVNFWVPIVPEDSLKIVAQTSEEIAYYKAMSSDRLKVDVTAVTTSADNESNGT